MRTHALLLLLALGACDSKAGTADKATAAAKADPKAAAQAQPEADAVKEAALIANAPPEGEVVDDKGAPNPLLDHQVTLLDGTVTTLAAYKGKALLVVNTASECGYTPQYEELQTLYARFRAQGLEVLAFPSNDYGAQEPGGADEIRKFVDENYKVEFPVFDKVVVKGPEKSALYKSLTEQGGEGIGGEVEWNFTKFLIDPSGKVVARFEPKVSPTDPEIIAAVERVLPKGS